MGAEQSAFVQGHIGLSDERISIPEHGQLGGLLADRLSIGILRLSADDAVLTDRSSHLGLVAFDVDQTFKVVLEQTQTKDRISLALQDTLDKTVECRISLAGWRR